MPDDGCLFCRISKGEIPASIVLENDNTMAFRDINPKAPVHILVIPREHFSGIHQIPANRYNIITDIFSMTTEVIKQEKLESKGYRLVVNFGKNSGQEVPHIHVHILAGREMHWPPG